MARNIPPYQIIGGIHPLHPPVVDAPGVKRGVVYVGLWGCVWLACNPAVNNG